MNPQKPTKPARRVLNPQARARDKPAQKPDRGANTNVVNDIKSYEKKHIKQ